MKSAKREKHKHRSFTLAICPSDRYNPRYINIPYGLLLLGILAVLGLSTYSFLIIKSLPSQQNIPESYQETRILNNLQSTKITIAMNKHKYLKEHIHKLKIQEEEIKELLSINFDGERSHKVDLYSYPMITTHRIVSKKGELGRVLIDNNIVVEYFDNADNPSAYQRALITAERIKSYLASNATQKKYYIKKTGEKVAAYINNQTLFVVYPSDLTFLSEKISTKALAKHWLSNIREALARQEEQKNLADKFPLLDREYRKKSKLYKTIYTRIDYPAYSVMLDESNLQGGQNINHLLKLAQQEVVTYEKSFNDLINTVQSYKLRFEYTPSIVPLHNTLILSGFGWRSHPILRVVRFHTGLDLPNLAGAPIYASASGTVSKVGWMGGYGNRVEIDHGYGFSTLYGHNSANLVEVGQKVYKGQMIAKVGMTGLAQGDHCHYEVRFFDRPVNPERFLNLNIFSASKNW